MAAYGLQTTPGQVAFTGFTGILGAGQANVPSSSGGYVQFSGVQQGDATIARMLRNGGASAGVTKLLYTLLGAAAGTTATKTKAQVQGASGAPSPMPVIETINLVNRATTAADLTAFQALLNRSPVPSSYPADLSGNGGGGKAGY